MTNDQENLNTILLVVKGLGELSKEVVFVGGAVISLYVDVKTSDEIRPTDDIDITVQITTISELENFRIKLNQKGFNHDIEDGVICRFRYKGVKVDIMATEEIDWAPSNQWFAEGFLYRIKVEVAGETINILPISYYLASKIAAFNSRGGSDPRTSHDFEDIVYILVNRPRFKEDILTAPENVQLYLSDFFNQILQSSLYKEAILAHIGPNFQMEKYERIVSALKDLIEG